MKPDKKRIRFAFNPTDKPVVKLLRYGVYGGIVPDWAIKPCGILTVIDRAYRAWFKQLKLLEPVYPSQVNAMRFCRPPGVRILNLPGKPVGSLQMRYRCKRRFCPWCLGRSLLLTHRQLRARLIGQPVTSFTLQTPIYGEDLKIIREQISVYRRQVAQWMNKKPGELSWAAVRLYPGPNGSGVVLYVYGLILRPVKACEPPAGFKLVRAVTRFKFSEKALGRTLVQAIGVPGWLFQLRKAPWRFQEAEWLKGFVVQITRESRKLKK